MTHRIWSALQRTLIHTLAWLAPATGQRRRGISPARSTSTTRRTVSGLRLTIRALNPPHNPAGHRPIPPPPARKPDPLVRPYLLAHEQHQRRTALALALDGIDIGPPVIHGHRIGTPATAVSIR